MTLAWCALAHVPRQAQDQSAVALSGAAFGVGWLGYWPDGASFGDSMEQWNSTGRDIAAEFNAVVNCSSRHEMAMSFPINAANGAPRDGVVAFNRLAEMGATMDMYVNGGGLQKAMSSLSKVSSCQTATAFDALSVR